MSHEALSRNLDNTNPYQNLEGTEGANAEWSTETQNALSQSIHGSLDTLAAEVNPYLEVQRGDTLAAVVRGLTGDLDWAQAVDYRSDRLAADAKPDVLSAANLIYPGQFVWIENGIIIVADVVPGDTNNNREEAPPTEINDGGTSVLVEPFAQPSDNGTSVIVEPLEQNDDGGTDVIVEPIPDNGTDVVVEEQDSGTNVIVEARNGTDEAVIPPFDGSLPFDGALAGEPSLNQRIANSVNGGTRVEVEEQESGTDVIVEGGERETNVEVEPLADQTPEVTDEADNSAEEGASVDLSPIQQRLLDEAEAEEGLTVEQRIALMQARDAAEDLAEAAAEGLRARALVEASDEDALNIIPHKLENIWNRPPNWFAEKLAARSMFPLWPYHFWGIPGDRQQNVVRWLTSEDGRAFLAQQDQTFGQYWEARVNNN